MGKGLWGTRCQLTLAAHTGMWAPRGSPLWGSLGQRLWSAPGRELGSTGGYWGWGSAGEQCEGLDLPAWFRVGSAGAVPGMLILPGPHRTCLGLQPLSAALPWRDMALTWHPGCALPCPHSAGTMAATGASISHRSVTTEQILGHSEVVQGTSSHVAPPAWCQQLWHGPRLGGSSLSLFCRSRAAACSPPCPSARSGSPHLLSSLPQEPH